MKRSTYMVAALLLMVAVQLHAQAPVSLELRGGVAIPAEDLGDAELKTGGGFGFTASYALLPHTLVYAGWEWYQLGLKKGAAGAFTGISHVENNGYAFGLGFEHPLFASVGGWLRAGGLYNHIELEDDDRDFVADSGHEFGWEAGGGLVIPVGRFALMPGARYRTFSADVDVGDGPIAVDMSYITIDLGVSYSFGRRPALTALRR